MDSVASTVDCLEFRLLDWKTMFTDGQSPGGSRLGVPFMRAQRESIDLSVGGKAISLHQMSEGSSAISGVVWDCGLLLVDLLSNLIDRKRGQKCILKFEGSNNDDASSDGDSSNSNISCSSNALITSTTPANSSSRRNQVCEILPHSFLDCVTDLGCGTGVVGIAALELGSQLVVFSDVLQTSSMISNIEPYINRSCAGGSSGDDASRGSDSDIYSGCPRAKFVKFDWNDEPPMELMSSATGDKDIVWDSLLCSDVLYDAKNHICFLQTLRRLRFNRCFLAYKRRHDKPEEQIFETMSAYFNIHVFDSSCITLVNIDPKLLNGLYIVYLTPKG